METVKDVFDKFRQALERRYASNEIASVTQLVLMTVTSQSLAKLRAYPEYVLMPSDRTVINEILDKIKAGMPVQYAIGTADFYDLVFKVTPDVLIPRPETEELVQWLLDDIKAIHLNNSSILDIGTGSGCIAIALKKNRPDAVVTALDFSGRALEVARQNADSNHVEITLINDDILNSRLIADSSIQYDIIVSNPPYVTQSDKQIMHERVVNYEPHTALFVPEENPLLFYEAIADFAQYKLKTGGWLYLEINESLGEATVDLLVKKSLKHVTLRKDMFGKDRMIKASR